jgi:hypothetical protein
MTDEEKITTAELLRSLPHRSVRSLRHIAILAERLVAERRTEWRKDAGVAIHAEPRKRQTCWTCDFCQKGFWFRSRAEKHTHGCTRNPSRICGFCIAGKLSQQPLTTLMAVLSQGKSDHGISELRELAQGCPACMYAALRQSSLAWNGHFNFKAEREKFLRVQEVSHHLDGETSFDHHILRKKCFEVALETVIEKARGKKAA